MCVFVVLVHLLIVALSVTIATARSNRRLYRENYACLHGKTVIITGANSGIGFYTALELAERGARCVLACRDMDKANSARRRIMHETQNANIVVKRLDLSSLESVREFCQQINTEEPRVDILINNAGALHLGNHITADNLQLTWQVNYFSPFLLTNLLLDKLRTFDGKIVNVTGSFCTFRTHLNDLNLYWNTNYVTISDTLAYFNAKSALYNFTMELSNRLKTTNCTVSVFEANLNSSNFWRRVYMGLNALVYLCLHLLFPKPQDEAKNLVNLMLNNPSIENVENDEYLSGELWKKSCQYVKLNEGY